MPEIITARPDGTPVQKCSIKAAVGVDPGLFERQVKLIEARRASWLAQAAGAKRELLHKSMKPVSLVKSQKDAASFQGGKMVAGGTPDSVCNKPLPPGVRFILDFGEHPTGHLVFSLRAFDIPVDAPVFGARPAEVSEPFDFYQGVLARSWIPDEVFNFDDVPQTVTLPHREAFR